AAAVRRWVGAWCPQVVRVVFTSGGGGGGSAPAEGRGDVGEHRLDQVGVVVHAELVGHGEQEGVGGGDRLVAGELVDEDVGLGGVGAAEDRPGGVVDVADLVLALAAPAEVGAVAVVDDGHDRAADRHARLAVPAGLGPRLAVTLDL